MKNMELTFIKDMFDTIAPRYDLLNRLLSFRQDVYWRRAMVSEIKIPDNGTALDVACGTGDVAFEIIRQKSSNAAVVGIDFSPRMLSVCKNKVIKDYTKRAKTTANIHLVAGDALYLPFKAETFDVITIAFGIRNICDRLAVLKIFHNCLKTKGQLLVLELATPPKGLPLLFYLFYSKKILPLIGWFFSRNIKAYEYLPSSVASFPAPDAFAATIRSAGFKNIRHKALTIGAATLYVGYKA